MLKYGQFNPRFKTPYGFFNSPFGREYVKVQDISALSNIVSPFRCDFLIHFFPFCFRENGRDRHGGGPLPLLVKQAAEGGPARTELHR